MPSAEHTSGDGPAHEASRTGASRLRILQVLRQATEGLGVQELAEQVGLHANTVRFHLERLVGVSVSSSGVQVQAVGSAR